MAKTHVAKVADVANVASGQLRDEPAHRSHLKVATFAEFPRHVASAAGELGLLSHRPTRKKSPAHRQNGRHRSARAKEKSRRERPIGSSLKGTILRAIYVRMAMWLKKIGESPCVETTDTEIADLLPKLIGSDNANRVAASPHERVRAVSQMAYDWCAVIGRGATCTAEDVPLEVTFYLEGGSGERRFAMAAHLRVNGARTPIATAPVVGAQPAVSLTQLLTETTEYSAPYLRWAEEIRIAAENGDPQAQRAIRLLRGVTFVAKGTAYTVVAVLVLTLTFFTFASEETQDRVIERIMNSWPLVDETPDNSLPKRLELNVEPDAQDDNFTVHWISDTEATFTVRHPEKKAAKLRANHGQPVEHIEWLWQVRLGHLPAPIFKLTLNPQLRVVFDRPYVGPQRKEIGFGVEPRHVVGSVGYTVVGVPPESQPQFEPPQPGHSDLSDRLVIADPRTHDVQPRIDFESTQTPPSQTQSQQ